MRLHHDRVPPACLIADRLDDDAFDLETIDRFPADDLLLADLHLVKKRIQRGEALHVRRPGVGDERVKRMRRCTGREDRAAAVATETQTTEKRPRSGRNRRALLLRESNRVGRRVLPLDCHHGERARRTRDPGQPGGRSLVVGCDDSRLCRLQRAPRRQSRRTDREGPSRRARQSTSRRATSAGFPVCPPLGPRA